MLYKTLVIFITINVLEMEFFGTYPSGMFVMSCQDSDCHMSYSNEESKSITNKLLACLRLRMFSKGEKRFFIIITIL